MHQAWRTVGVLASFAVRHAWAAALMAGLAGVFWTLAYLGLLVWAVVSDAGIGSPLVYPVGLMLGVVAALLVSALGFLPACLLGEIVCRWRGWPALAGVPVSFAGGMVIAVGWSGIAHLVQPLEPLQFWTLALGMVCLGALPLGVYWWAAEFPHVLREVMRVVQRWWAGRRREQGS